jgi:hypothetical protein
MAELAMEAANAEDTVAGASLHFPHGLGRGKLFPG